MAPRLRWSFALACAGQLTILAADRGAFDHSGVLALDDPDPEPTAPEADQKEAPVDQAPPEPEAKPTDAADSHEAGASSVSHRLGYHGFRAHEEEDRREFAKFPALVEVLEKRAEKVIANSKSWNHLLGRINQGDADFSQLIKKFGASVKQDHLAKVKRVETVLRGNESSNASSQEAKEESTESKVGESSEHEADTSAESAAKGEAQQEEQAADKTEESQELTQEELSNFNFTKDVTGSENKEREEAERKRQQEEERKRQQEEDKTESEKQEETPAAEENRTGDEEPTQEPKPVEAGSKVEDDDPPAPTE